MDSVVLTRMLDDVNVKASAYAKAYNLGKPKSELKALKSAATDAVNKYNLQLSKETYLRWNAEGDAVKTAIRSRVIPNAKKISFKVDDENYMTVMVNAAEYEVNLPMMQATLGKGVFANQQWFNKAEKLMYLITEDVNDRMGGGIGFDYDIEKASKEFNFDGDPLSSEGILHAMQEVFDAILFIENKDAPGTNLLKITPVKTRRGDIDATEWRVIRESMTREAGVNKVAICNTGKFTNLIMRAMHGILTSGDFSLEIDGGVFKMPESTGTIPSINTDVKKSVSDGAADKPKKKATKKTK